MKTKNGFTLIEVLIVVTIIGILAAMIVPRIMGRPDQARVLAAKIDCRTIAGAIKLFYLDNRRYPTTEQGLSALVKKPTSAPVPANWNPSGYLDGVPKDPWGNEYQYSSPGAHGEYDVWSLGADGQPGGQGKDADIGSWNLDD